MFVHAPAHKGDLMRKILIVGQDGLMPAKEYKARVRASHRRERRLALSSATVTLPSQDISAPVYGDPQSSMPRESMDPDWLWDARRCNRRTTHHKPAHNHGYRSGRTGNGSGVCFSKSGSGGARKPRDDHYGHWGPVAPGAVHSVRVRKEITHWDVERHMEVTETLLVYVHPNRVNRP